MVVTWSLHGHYIIVTWSLHCHCRVLSSTSVIGLETRVVFETSQSNSSQQISQIIWKDVRAETM